MANIKPYSTKFDMACKAMKNLYDLGNELQQKKSPTMQDSQKFLVRYRDIERYRQQIEECYTVLVSNPVDPQNEGYKLELDKNFATFMDMFYSVQVLHTNLLDAYNASAASSGSQHKSSNSSNDFHLPKITLPRFSGIHTEWPNFISIFNSLIHQNSSLSAVEKMHYLLSVLDKDALCTVKHLLISDANYMVAYNLLTEQYENKRVIANKHVETLLNLPNLTQVNFKSLNKFVNTIKEHTYALKALQFDIDSWSFLLLHVIFKKISKDMRDKFESSIDPLCIPTFNQLLKFLEKELRVSENSSSSSSKPFASSVMVVDSENKSQVKNYFSSCPCCNENHQVYYCPKFDAMTPEDRKSFVLKNKLCFNCLRTHSVSKCTSRSRCQVCRGRHHTKLHQSDNEPASTPKVNEAAVSTVSSTVQLQSLHGVDHTSTMVLGTALVSVQDVNGYYQSARALIDSGSQVSIVSENLAQKLKLPRTQSGIILGLGASSSQQTRGIVQCNIRSLRDSTHVLTADCTVLKRITGNLPSVPVNKSVLRMCENLVLADKHFTVPGQIDILLGIDLYDQIFDGRKFSLGDNMPTAYSSIFGWIIMGKAPAASLHINSATSMACTLDLNLALTRFWESEEPPSQPLQDPEDIQCEKHFSTSYKRDDTGRFIVKLPFKVNHKPLGDTHSNALKRFLSLERRLLKEVRLRELYVAFMRDYHDAGHMRLVTSPVSHERYYIPHHGVLREHSSSTKLRAVFDASAPSSTGVSLNQVLMSGPKLQKNIEDIILRFRVHQIVFTCDIKQMYRQVRMSDEDCKYQTILWRESPDEPIEQYELTTVTYGVTSSAYQAIRVIHELAYLNREEQPEASRVLLEDTFVDDIVSGASNFDSAKDLQQKIVNILAQGGFILRKWSSNSKEFLDLFASDHCEPPYRFEEDGDNVYKVLGIEWNARTDSFIYHVSEMNNAMTMRGVLSNIARLYDPCGFLAPVTFFAKHIMQRLWSLQYGWDDPLPPEIQRIWSDFMSDFNQLEKVSIPRWVLIDQFVDCQLHGFSDASERGYAACVYLRVQETNRVLVQLLLAKSRVAPLKQKITIPKLELNGALLLARLLKHVLDIYHARMKISSTIAWCDSSIVLSWLKTSPHKLQTYEGNRVSQIQAIIPNAVWKHVPSALNPADSASRGVSPSELVDHSLWWSPTWLEDDSSSWPGDVPRISEAELPGLKSPTTVSYVVEEKQELPLLTKLSSFPKLQSVVAWCKRFIYNSRNPTQKRTGPLSVTELDDSLKNIVKLVQSTEFPEAIKLLRENKPLKGSIMRLNPFLDSQGLLRVGGRLVKSELDYSSKHPLLLPKRHHVTNILVEHYHRVYLHPGVNSLMNILQRKFWIISARQVIRHQIFRCQRCYRLRPKSSTPFMGDLPAHRVTSCRPFQKVGVDFAGPFMLKTSRIRSARSYKSYLCIYVCFTTKCVHLEIVSELSTEAFLACFDRFVSRRGVPSDVFSDCGTNFIGARNYLKEVTQYFFNNHNKIFGALANQGVTWHLNPPASPHMGGLWESAVRSAKLILTRVIGNRSLTFEELATIFTKVEAALNSRPLCPMTNDPCDLDVLTPGHFIIGKLLQALPEYNLDDNTNLLKRWQLLRQINQHFWKRWHVEYLHTLQQRPKWLSKIPNAQVGDLVLIKEPNLPPLYWKKGRITKVFPGSDGIVRVVELRTATGTLLRPIVKICPLLPYLSDDQL